MRRSASRVPVRAGVAGATAALVLGGLPVLIAPAAQAAPVELTAAQARSAFVSARTTTIKKLLKSGGRIATTVDDQGDEDFKHSAWAYQARIDAKRQSMRKSQRATALWPPVAASYVDITCGTGPGGWSLAKDQVGRWESLGSRSGEERKALARVGKPKATWAKRGGKGTRLSPRVQALVVDAARYTFTGGTRESIAGGSRLSLTIRGGATVGLLVDGSGAINRLELNRTHRLYDGIYAERTLTRVGYSAQSVPTPARSRWVTAATLNESCATPTLRADTKQAAKDIARYANRKADGRTEAADIKAATRGWIMQPYMSKRLVKAGARITGRTSLAPRAYVFDIVVRNGKAVVLDR